MAIKVKNANDSATKWQERAASAADLFASGAQAAADTWATNTQNAAPNFKSAIQASGIETRFAAGVRKAGAAKFVRKIIDVAKDRFAPGVRAAQSDYQQGIEPYLATIAAIPLSARKPRGDPANLDRVRQVDAALNAKRLATLGMKAG